MLSICDDEQYFFEALLIISVKAVERQRANILEKLGTRNRTEPHPIRRPGLIEP